MIWGGATCDTHPGELVRFNGGKRWVICSECGAKIRDFRVCVVTNCFVEGTYASYCHDPFKPDYACDDHQWELCCPMEVS